MPIPSHNFEIYAGLTFPGFSIILLDSAGAAVTQDAGTTYLLQARNAAGKALAFALTVTRGTEATGQVIIAERSAAVTADFPLGTYVYDCVPIDTDDKAYSPLFTGVITVKKAVSEVS